MELGRFRFVGLLCLVLLHYYPELTKNALDTEDAFKLVGSRTRKTKLYSHPYGSCPGLSRWDRPETPYDHSLEVETTSTYNLS